MTQDELKNAVLDALFEYETLKKTRRLKALKKALRGTVMATVLSSTGVMAATDGERTGQIKGNNATTASSLNLIRKADVGNRNNNNIAATPSSPNVMPTIQKPFQIQKHQDFVLAAALFGFNKHTLLPAQEVQLMELVKKLPAGAELTIIGRTDAKGNREYNRVLGIKRATGIAKFLANQGIKIKGVKSKISDEMRESWMSRRVDIIVDSTLASSTTDTPSIAKPYVMQQPTPQVESHIPSPIINPPNAALNNTNKNYSIGNTITRTTKADANTDFKELSPDQPMPQGHWVRGVTHFAENQSELALLHKERLLELVKQFPKDALITVIARTDEQSGDTDKQKVGLQRAKNVAIYLVNHGIKVKEIGSVVSNEGFSGWTSRRVDIVAESNLFFKTIHLPPVIEKPIRP